MPGLKVCAQPGCPVLTRGVRCAEHQAAITGRYVRASGSAASQGYDAAWRRVRIQVLRDEPFCRRHRATDPRSLVLATQVDHIVPLIEGGPRLDHDNLQPICDECHRIKGVEDRQRRGEIR